MSYPTIDTFAYAPVIAGMWQQHEVFDGTYDLDDLLDAHEILFVKAENERRAMEASKHERGE